MIDEIEMEKDCPKEDLRKKFHLEWEAFVEDFRETLCPEDKAYLLMEEKKNYKDWKAKNAKRPVIDID